MPRETVAEKAHRLLEAGAVTLVDEIDDDPHVWLFKVSGDSGLYDVSASEGETVCNCPANGVCAHRRAVHMWLERGEQEALEAVEVFEGVVVVDSPSGDDDQGEGEDSSLHVASSSPTSDTQRHTDESPSPAPLATYDPPPAELGAMFLSPIKAYRDQAWGTLAQVCDPKVQMVPKAYQGKPAAALAAGLLGRDWGLGFVESLQYIDVIEGSVQPSAELRLRKYRAAGHKLRIEKETDESITLTGQRGDNGDELTVSYSIHDAERMGRLKVTEDGKVKARSKSNAPMIWEKDTADMLWWGAVRRLVRRLAPDCMDRREAT